MTLRNAFNLQPIKRNYSVDKSRRLPWIVIFQLVNKFWSTVTMVLVSNSLPVFVIRILTLRRKIVSSLSYCLLLLFTHTHTHPPLSILHELESIWFVFWTPLRTLYMHTHTHTHISCSILILHSPSKHDGPELISSTHYGHTHQQKKKAHK